MRSVLVCCLLVLLVTRARVVHGDDCCDTAAGCFDTPSEGYCADVGGPGATFVPNAICDYDTGGCAAASTTTTTTPGGTTTTTLFTPPADGRLNPEPDEAYALYCAFDTLEIWRGVPSGLLLGTARLTAVLDLTLGACLDAAGATVCRQGDDAWAVRGTNGNAAPAEGVKPFTMTECLERNGGVPFVTTTTLPGATTTTLPAGAADCTDGAWYADHVEECTRGAGWMDEDCIGWIFVYFDNRLRDGRARAAAAVDVLALYRLRDHVLLGTPGGVRATRRYYASSPALAAAVFAHPGILLAGRDALAAWRPILDALTGDGPADVTVSAAQTAAFLTFLDAVRAGVGDGLRTALEREVLLVDPAGFTGLTPAAMLARLDRLACDVAPTLASVRCRLGDVATVVADHVEGGVQRRLARSVARARRHAERADDAASSARTRRRARTRLARLLTRLDGGLARRSTARTLADAVAGVLRDDVAGIRRDVGALPD